MFSTPNHVQLMTANEAVMWVFAYSSDDDGPGGGERPLATQSVSEDHLGGGDRESREYSQQVTATIKSRVRCICLRGLFERSKACVCVFVFCFLNLPGCHLSVMTHRQSCKESLLSILTGATPETLFKGLERSQGTTITNPRHGTSASFTELL